MSSGVCEQDKLEPQEMGEMMAISCIIDTARRLLDELKIENDLVFTAPGPMKGSASDKGEDSLHSRRGHFAVSVWCKYSRLNVDSSSSIY